MAREIVFKLSGHETEELLGLFDEVMGLPELSENDAVLESLQKMKDIIFGKGPR